MDLTGWVESFGDPDVVFRASATLLGLGQLVTTAEYLSIRSELGPGGIYRWRTLRIGHPARIAALGPWRERVFGPHGTDVLFGVRLGLAALLVAFAATPAVAGPTVAALAAVLLLCNVRLRWGLEAADNLAVHTALGLTAFAACRAVGTEGIGLPYLAAYAGLAYVTAGVTKLIEPTWRSGEALGRVLNLESFGSPSAERALAPRPRLRQGLSWIVILAELAAPLALLLPAPWLVAALVAGLCFHLTLGVVMGLNTFVWSFAATYPAVLLLWTMLHDVTV